jgi:hypothetical protein
LRKGNTQTHFNNRNIGRVGLLYRHTHIYRHTYARVKTHTYIRIHMISFIYILYTLSGGGGKHAEGACNISIHPHKGGSTTRRGEHMIRRDKHMRKNLFDSTVGIVLG